MTDEQPEIQKPGCLPPGMSIDSMLTYEQTAIWLNLPVKTLREMVNVGKIPCLRLGHRTVRFSPRKIQELVKL